MDLAASQCPHNVVPCCIKPMLVFTDPKENHAAVVKNINIGQSGRKYDENITSVVGQIEYDGF